jgi:hypothetical protein
MAAVTGKIDHLSLEKLAKARHSVGLDGFTSQSLQNTSTERIEKK